MLKSASTVQHEKKKKKLTNLVVNIFCFGNFCENPRQPIC